MNASFQGKESDNLLDAPIIFIEPTNRCNLSCIMCPTNREMGRKKGRIDRATFQNVIDEVASEKPFLNFWGWGEPVLHPEIFAMIRYAADKGVKVRMSTNIEPLNGDGIKKLVDSGLYMVLIPMDGFSQEAHSAYRIGGNVEKVKDRIGLITLAKSTAQVETPFVTVLTLATKQAIPELDRLDSFCKEVSADAFMLKIPNLWRSGKSQVDELKLYQEFISENESFSRYHKTDNGNLQGPGGNCPFLDKNGTILWNGDITVCCYDHEGRYSFGNVNDDGGYTQALKSTLKSERWEQMSRKEFDICKKCDGAGPRTKITLYNNSLTMSDFAYL